MYISVAAKPQCQEGRRGAGRGAGENHGWT